MSMIQSGMALTGAMIVQFDDQKEIPVIRAEHTWYIWLDGVQIKAPDQDELNALFSAGKKIPPEGGKGRETDV